MGRCHIIREPNAPASAPLASGDHFVNTANGDIYLSNGTASVANWVPSGGMSSSPISYCFASDGKLYLKAKDGTYINEAYVPFPGSTKSGTPTKILLECATKGAITADIKIFDRTSGLTIVTKTLFASAVDEVFETLDLGTLANIPTVYGAWEFQVQLSATGAGKEFWCGSLTIY